MCQAAAPVATKHGYIPPHAEVLSIAAAHVRHHSPGRQALDEFPDPWPDCEPAPTILVWESGILACLVAWLALGTSLPTLMKHAIADNLSLKDRLMMLEPTK